MSTKVYTAYRLKNSRDLWPVVRDIKQRGKRAVQRELAKVYELTRASVDTSTEEYKSALHYYDGDDWLARHRIAQRLLGDAYRKQLGSSQRDEYNFDVSVGIWERSGTMYLIPYCDMFLRNVLDFMKRDKRLEDFAYWNNTDKPPRISNAEWNKRGKVWSTIDAAGWENHLAIDVCSWSAWYLIDPWLNLGRKYTARKRSLRR